MSNKIKGKYGEDTAVNYLIKCGYKILERNYHFSRYGEVDIIALDNDTVCFIEVKMRSNDKFGTPFEAITRSKLEKIKKCAYFYLQNIKIPYKNFRIDAVSIISGSLKGVQEISLIKNVEF